MYIICKCLCVLTQECLLVLDTLPVVFKINVDFKNNFAHLEAERKD